MADYINRNLIEWYGCNFEDANCKNRECSGCSHAECSHSQVMQIPAADVIERSEYDKMIQAFIDREESLRQVLVDTRNSYLKLEKEYAELKAKFDKAIEDMENEVKFWKEPPKYDVSSVNNARIAKAQSYAHAIEILKGYKGD